MNVSALKHFFTTQYDDDALLGMRLCIGSFIGLITGGLAALLILIFEPVPLMPVELMGSLAYMEDINISNRLFAVAACLFISLAVFLVAGFGPWSHFLAEKILRSRIYEQCCHLFTRLQGRASRLTESILVLGRPEPALKELRRQQGKWLFPGVAFAFAVPSMLALVTRVVMSYLWHDALLLSWPALKIFFFVILQGALFGLLAYSWLKSPGVILPRFVLWMQYALLPLFFLLLPTPASNGQVILHALPSGRLIWVVLGLIAWGVADILHRRRRDWGKGLFSPIALLALLLSYAMPLGLYPAIWANTYELGSRLPQFWMVSSGYLRLFADMYITYGLYDMVGLALGWLAFGQNTVIAASAGMALLSVILQSALFLLALRFLPPVGAFILAFYMGGEAGATVCLYAGVLLLPALIKRPVIWLMVWVALSALFPFARIPQGTIAVLASLPGAAFQAYRLLRHNLVHVAAVLAFGITAAVLVFIWPFGDHFLGRWRLARYRQNHRAETLLRRRVGSRLGQSALLLEP